MGRKNKNPPPGKSGSHSKAGASKVTPAAPTAAVALSAAHRKQVLNILEDLSQESADPSAAASQLSSKQAAKLYENVYDKLTDYGFRQEQIQLVLRTLAQDGVSVESALDWLCINIPATELPRGFASVTGAGGEAQVRIVRRADLEAASQDPVASWDDHPEASAPEAAEQLPESRVPVVARNAAGRTEEEEQKHKAWIMQYVGGGDDSDEEGGGASSDSEFDDWELWADPREVQRRRAERTRAKIPKEIRKQQVSEEWFRTKQGAAAAKASGDKAKQKEAGLLIRQLKEEMLALGLSEDAAEKLVSLSHPSNHPAKQSQSKAEPKPSKPVSSTPKTLAKSIREPTSELTQPNSDDDGFMPDFSLLEEEGNNNTTASSSNKNMARKLDTNDRVDTSNRIAGSNQLDAINNLTGANRLDVSNPLDSAARSDVSNPLAGAAQSVHNQSDVSNRLDGANRSGVSNQVDDANGSGHSNQVDGANGSGHSNQVDGAGDKALGVGEGDDEDMNFNLFDMDDETAASLPSIAVAASTQAKAPEVIEAWGSYNSGPSGKAVKKGGRAAAVAQQEAQRLPKALLQQFCQKMQWNPPRFERSPIGGASGGPRYSVTVDPGVIRGKDKKRAGLKGPRTWQVVGEEDDWSNIQDAQNAAALWALYHLQPDQGMQHVLPPMFRDLWLRWEKNKADAAAADVSAQKASKQEFVLSLLEEKQQQQLQLQQQQGLQKAAGRSDVVGDDGDSVGGESDRGTNWEAAVADTIKEEELTVAEKRRGSALRAEQSRWASSPQGKEWQKKRMQLPIAAIREAVLDALTKHDVVVVSGDTGCGKTTQVPHYLLEDAISSGRGGACSIVCTQPRRLAAISVAERVAAERGEGEPGRPGCLVGYHVRLDAATTRDTQLLFCTTGILLRRLAGDPLLRGVSHIVVDEVHERSLQTDFLMALLKDLLSQRARKGRRLKVILMSATLDARRFSEYFSGCPALNAEGRTFPVQHLFLEDAYEATSYLLASDAPAAVRYRGARGLNAYKKQTGGNRSQQQLVKSGWGDDEADLGPLNPDYDPALYHGYSDNTRLSLSRVEEDVIDFDLLQELVNYIDETQPPGAILVFLPGMAEITNIYERLASTRKFAQGNHWLLPLHSTVSPAEQHKVFSVPPEGVRKIVLSTNIAETSLTIEDVVYVVDTGKHKERRYDPARRMSMLVEDWVARASALQRKGRAGRVRPGMCFALYTKKRFEERMRAYGVPEISRVPLEELVLQIHLMKLGQSGAFLARLLEPPSAKAIAAAVETLQSVGALTVEQAKEELTPLGQHLALLPLDPRLGKLLVLGALLGCLGPAATIAASLSYKSPFSARFDQQDQIQAARAELVATGGKTLAAGQQSDHLLLVAAYGTWRDTLRLTGRTAANKVAQRQMMSVQTLQALAEMRGQFAAMLADIRLLTVPPEQLAKRPRAGEEPEWVDDAKAQWNKFANDPAMVKSVLCGALAPNVAELSNARAQAQKGTWLDSKGEELFVHPSSVIASVKTNAFRHRHAVFLEKVKTSRVFMRECTVVGPMALLLFGGALTVLHDQGAIVVDNWLRIKADARTGALVKKLRAALDAALLEKISKPQLPLNEKVMSLVAQLVASDGQLQ